MRHLAVSDRKTDARRDGCVGSSADGAVVLALNDQLAGWGRLP
jgi:hypothetical protein